MNVTLIGMGSGQPENLTLQGLAALRQADLILGARRLLAVLPAGCTKNRAAAYRPDEVTELLQGEHGIKDWVEANYTVELDIDKLGDRMIEAIEAKRKALGIALNLR